MAVEVDKLVPQDHMAVAAAVVAAAVSAAVVQHMFH
jgi:hypothetical protein